MNGYVIIAGLIGFAAIGSSPAADAGGDGRTNREVGSRNPVTPVFLPLRPGAVEPQGWLRDWAMSMRDGMTGHLDEYDPVFRLGWLGQGIGTTGEHAPGEGWPLEQAAYWIDGAVRLGHVLHDEALLARVMPRLEKIAEPDKGNGSYLWWREKFSWDGKNGPPVEGFDLWSCGVLGRALSAQYQATGDRKWLACIERFFGSMPGGSLFPIDRTTVNIETLHEADRLGADPRIWAAVVDAARRLRRDDGDWSRENYWAGMRPKDAKHGVTYNELAKLPLLLYAGTGDESFKRTTIGRYRDLFDKHVLPYGVNSASEHLAGIGGLQGTESCNVADLIWSQLWLLRILGDTADGDRIETAFFNAAPACVSRDCRMHVYYQSPNRPNPKPGAQGGKHPSGADFARTQKPLCCTGNIQRIVPNYIIHMWMATPDDGLAATLYGPCTVKAAVAGGVDVTLASTTDYPFGEDITVTVTPAKPVRFPLHFRIPGWCSKPSFKVNGADVASGGAVDGYVKIDRTWSGGDTVAIRFPMPPRVAKGRESGGSPYACVYAGPLLFARGVPENNENESTGAGWRYALDFESDRAADGMTIKRSAMPARWDWPHASPVTLAVPAQAIDWEPVDKVEGALPPTPVAGKGGGMIELIPYGCAKFRVSMFPVTARAFASSRVDANGATGAYVRANTDWLANCRYGLAVHWTARTVPQEGPPLPFQEVVAAFNLKNFMFTTHQDYWAGEELNLRTPAEARYLDNGLQWFGWTCLDDRNWVHTKPNRQIPKPLYHDEAVISHVRTCNSHQGPMTFNVGIYQDGTLAPASVELLHRLGEALGRKGGL